MEISITTKTTALTKSTRAGLPNLLSSVKRTKKFQTEILITLHYLHMPFYNN